MDVLYVCTVDVRELETMDTICRENNATRIRYLQELKIMRMEGS